MGERRGACGNLAGKLEGKRPLARTWRSWESNVEMILQEIRWEGVEWVDLPLGSSKWLADVIAVMNLLVL
jgi:hypothetical protein